MRGKQMALPERTWRFTRATLFASGPGYWQVRLWFWIGLAAGLACALLFAHPLLGWCVLITHLALAQLDHRRWRRHERHRLTEH